MLDIRILPFGSSVNKITTFWWNSNREKLSIKLSAELQLLNKKFKEQFADKIDRLSCLSVSSVVCTQEEFC